MNKKILSGSAVVFFVLFSVSLVSAANTRYVATTGSDTSNNCLTLATPCQTIQHGIDQAVDGDTVSVAAGTYNENQISITKSISVTGAGASTTIIDGGDATLATDGLIRITATGDVTFSGFTVRNAGGPVNGGDGGDNKDNFNIWMLETSSSSVTYTITNNKIYGRNVEADYSDFGVYAVPGSLENLIFTYNTVTQTGNNNVLIERVTGSTDISHNTLDAGDYGTTAIFYMTYGGTDITTLQNVSFNTIDMSSGGPFDSDHAASAISFSGSFRDDPGTSLGSGKYTDVMITGNNIINVQSYRRGIALADMDPTGAAGSVLNAEILRNNITGISNTGSIGIRLAGLITNADIEGNQITNTGTGVYGQNAVQFANGATQYPTGTTLNFNNIFGNGIGLQWDGATAFNAIKNWWGSSTGPSHSPGSGDKIIGNINYDPWLCAPYPTTWYSINGQCVSGPTMSPYLMVLLVGSMAVIGMIAIKRIKA